LAKCGYCQWFDDQLGLCTEPAAAGMFEARAEAIPPCGYHAPRRAILVRREGRLALVVAAGLAAAVFALGYGVVRLALPGPGPARPAGELQLAVEADYRGARVGETYTVMGQMYNTSDVVVTGVRFEILREFLGHFALRQVTPRPDRIAESGKWAVLAYPDLSPRERRTIRLDLEPKQAGVFHLKAQLASSDGGYHGMADLPIVVESKNREH
jgi:hypothetical protein